MTIPTAACAPWRDGASIRCGRSCCAYERENHGCDAAGADWADTYVSSKILRKLKKIAPREPTILMGVAPACQRTVRVCYIRGSVSATNRLKCSVWSLVSSQSFPHLCK